MRSYIKVFYKRSGEPNFLDQYYATLGEVPDGAPDAILAFDRLRKHQFVTNLNLLSYAWVTYWGNAARPEDIIPQWFFDNGGSAFQTTSLFSVNFGPWAPGVWFPFTDYASHPKN